MSRMTTPDASGVRTSPLRGISRRDVLRAFGVGAAALTVDVENAWAADRRLRGIFPIVQTPYTESDAVDFDVLADEVRFLDRTGVHGIVWPQLASQYFLLSDDERLRGAETIVEAAKGLSPAVVIGVQATDTDTAVKFARHAMRLQPDAIIALPPDRGADLDLEQTKRYYASIAAACDLPLFVQTTASMSVEFVLGMAREIPTLRFIKDEGGNTLSRMLEFHERKGALDLSVFSGAHGRTLLDELMRGSAGTMPTAGWADLYVGVWDAWHAGRYDAARDLFGKALLFITQTRPFGLPGYHYVLHLRGVFPNWRGRGDLPVLDELARRSIEQNLEFVGEYLRA